MKATNCNKKNQLGKTFNGASIFHNVLDSSEIIYMRIPMGVGGRQILGGCSPSARNNK